MKKIIIVLLSTFLLTACGGGSSHSKKNIVPSERAAAVLNNGTIAFQRYIINTTPYSRFPFSMCRPAKGFMIITKNIVTGTIISGLGISYAIIGDYIPETREIDGGFTETGTSIAQYLGKIDMESGTGTWSDDFGCSGTWKALKE